MSAIAATNRDEATKSLEVVHRAVEQGDRDKATRCLLKAKRMLGPDEEDAAVAVLTSQIAAMCSTNPSTGAGAAGQAASTSASASRPGLSRLRQDGPMTDEELAAAAADCSMECCDFCQARGGKLLKCSRCQHARYCSKHCQRAAWRDASRPHKKECDSLAMREREMGHVLAKHFNAWYRRNYFTLSGMVTAGLLWSSPPCYTTHAVILATAYDPSSDKKITVTESLVVCVKEFELLRVQLQVPGPIADPSTPADMAAHLRTGEEMLLMVRVQDVMQYLLFPLPLGVDRAMIAADAREFAPLTALQMIGELVTRLV